MKARTPLAVAAVVCLCVTSAASAQTNVGGLITTNRTWTLTGSPYIVQSSVLIGNNATLTIQPGVEVRFNTGLGITVGSLQFGAGTLKAQGTAGSKVLFRSNSQPQNPGAWARIHFTDFAIDADFDGGGNYLTGSIIQHAIIEYAGAGSVPAVTIEQSRPYLSFCEIRHNSNRGIYMEGSGASTPPQRVDDCEVWDCQSIDGISVINGSGHRLARNNVHNCSGVGMRIDARCTLESNTVANNTNEGVWSGSQINGVTGHTLTSNTVTNNAGMGIRFNNSNGVGNHILTSNTVTGNAGQGIYFASAGSNTLTLNNVIGNGGRGSYFTSSGSNTLISNTITGNKGGIFLQSSGNCTLTSNVITNNTDNTGGGIYFQGSGNCTVRDNEIIGNHTTSLNQTGGIYIENSQNVNFAGDPVNAIFNRIHDNDGCDITNTMGYQANGSNDVLATNVWWGTCDEFAFSSEICDFFDDPSKGIVLYFSVSPPGSFAQCPGSDDPGCDDCDGDDETNACAISFGRPDEDGDGIPDDCCDAFPPTIVTTSPLPNGAVSIAYDQTLQAEADCGSVEWGLVTGALPPGLNLVAATGRIHGTPTDAGTFLFRVSATEANDLSAELDYALTIQAPIGTLAVTPSGTLTSEGYEFGPFAPLSRTYKLQNVGSTSINWTVAKGQVWVLLSGTSGTLQPIGAAGDTTFVTVSINAAAVNSFLPGLFNDTVTFTNTTNARGNTSRGVSLTVLTAQPAAGQDVPLIPDLLGHLWVWNDSTGNFEPPPGGTINLQLDQPTYLLTHGWDGDLDGDTCASPKYAMSSVGCAIRDEKPNANLLAWDWQGVGKANPNGVCDVPDSFTSTPTLLTLMAAGPIGAAVLLADNTISDAREAGQNAEVEGNKLGKALVKQIRAHGALGTELHFIGKSHGGGVLGRAAQELKKYGASYQPDSLTTLDTPKVACIFGGCLVNSLKYVEPDSVGHAAVYYYNQRAFGVPVNPHAGGFGAPVISSAGNLTNLLLNVELAPPFVDSILHLWIAGADDRTCSPPSGWFPHAVWLSYNAGFEGSTTVSSLLDVNSFPSGCYQETDLLYEFESLSCESAAARGQVANSDTPGISLIAYDPMLEVTTWSGTNASLVVNEDPTDPANKVVLLQELGDASFFKDIDWPANTLELTFDYMFKGALGGESLTVHIGNAPDDVVYYDNAETTLATGVLKSTGSLHVSHVAGTNSRLNFVLRTDISEGGLPGGELIIDNIRLYGLVAGDMDLDGDVDLADAALFQGCLTGTDPVSDACWALDLDNSQAVDLADHAEFLGGLTGPKRIPTLAPVP